MRVLVLALIFGLFLGGCGDDSVTPSSPPEVNDACAPGTIDELGAGWPGYCSGGQAIVWCPSGNTAWEEPPIDCECTCQEPEGLTGVLCACP